MSEDKRKEALKDLYFKIADDLLILGHRNSEWTGTGPILEEDIAFSSMAQDQLGQSLAFFNLLQKLGEKDPDSVAFSRNADQLHCCQFVELPIGEYDFSLIRHFLHDTASYLRFDMFTHSNEEELAQLARKLRGEVKYHTMHSHIWIKQLGKGTEESKARLQKSLYESLPYALGMFEESKFEDTLISEGIYPGEAKLREQWEHAIREVIDETELKMEADLGSIKPIMGGRYGTHTEHLQPMLEEMREVFSIDPSAEW